MQTIYHLAAFAIVWIFAVMIFGIFSEIILWVEMRKIQQRRRRFLDALSGNYRDL